MQEFEHGPRPDHEQQVARLAPASDKTTAAASVGDLAAAVKDLQICRACESELVQPVAWGQAVAGSWEITLRCPDCEWTITGTFEDEAVERFDEALERGVDALARDLRQLARVNMEEDVQRFAAALRAGHVLPEDF